jgi:hypothetical protein
MTMRSIAGSRGFRRALEECASACERALAHYPGASADALRFRETLTETVFVIRAATTVEPLDEQRLQLASHACRQVVELCRHHGLDRQLLDCAATCDRAAEMCEHALAA